MKILCLLIAFTTTLSAQGQQTRNAMEIGTGNIIRISIGYFQPGQTDRVENMIQHEFKESLIPAIKKLKGNFGYYVGIDKEKHMITNVSFWNNVENANQMSTLKEMLEMRNTFEALGLKFIEITNHEILWKLPE